MMSQLIHMQSNQANQGKTFYIQAYNNEGMLINKFEKYSMYEENEFYSFLERVEAKGLELITESTDPSFIITSLRNVIPMKY
ncbi:hypothetical protein C1645_818210 [Glomus cerebriforme]|uniref:Uncharacterized protein n=1 Tax=Glomus cerebriforme TaxID=658196 RepID=A0A397TCY1_9GLOM|nr:hypothetical protein C1645_818210 [Glomus cerebriforme]